MTMVDECRLGLPIRFFDDATGFACWLARAPRASPGIWLKLAKKGAGVTGLSKAQAIDAALCHGWIDGQQHPYDDRYWLTRFTPRKRGSRWSQINRTRVLELTSEGRMTAAGLAEVEAAKADGRWDAAYAPASTARPCAELQAALDASPRAAAAFAARKAAARYAILHRIAVLKTASARTRRIAQVVADLTA